eukprot:443149-Amphidinium_carterae.2
MFALPSPVVHHNDVDLPADLANSEATHGQQSAAGPKSGGQPNLARESATPNTVASEGDMSFGHTM